MWDYYASVSFHFLMSYIAVEEAAERLVDAQTKIIATIAEMTQISMEKATLEGKQTFLYFPFVF